MRGEGGVLVLKKVGFPSWKIHIFFKRYGFLRGEIPLLS